MPDRLYVLVGEAIRKRRDLIGMTQNALGERVKLSRTAITNIEQGRQTLSLHHLYRAADALGVEVCDLLPAATPSMGTMGGRSVDLGDLLDRLEPIVVKRRA